MKKKSKLSKLILLVILIISISIIGCTNKNEKLEEAISKTEFMMDTVMTIKIYDSDDNKILDKAYERLEEIEEKMSATIDTSEVNQINDNAGIEPVEVSPDTYLVLEEAKYHAEISDGAYEPTIGPLVKLWDIQTEYDEDREWIPEPDEIEEARKLVDYNKLELLDDNKVFLKEENMRLDLGGIVKGYAADEVRRVLQENGVDIAIIDLGGNIYAHGIKDNDEPWNIGIQNPLEATGEYLGIVEIEDKSIVTSGDYERYFDYDGVRYHHIIDSETGYPSDNEITGVTIVSDRSIDGDALSTTLFVLGVEKSTDLINSLEGVDAIFVTKDKTIYATSEIKDQFELREENSEFTIKEY